MGHTPLSGAVWVDQALLDMIKTLGPFVAGIVYLIWQQVSTIKTFTEDQRIREQKCDERYDGLNKFVRESFATAMEKNTSILERLEDHLERK